MLKKTFIWSLLVALPIALSGGLAQASTVTIATFADPSMNASNPLFTIDLVNDLITGGWLDSQTNLTLEVVYSGNTFVDAFFEMTALSYTSGLMGGGTGGGTVKFFADNQSTSTTPLIQITFDSATLSPTSLGGVELFGNDVTISGSEIVGSLTDESFAFSFANQALLPNEGGYTATAAFTSSAVPEPATIVLLGFGGLALLRRKTRA